MGIFGLFTSTGWSLGPFVGGILYDAFNTEPYLLWGGVSLFAIVSAIGYFAMRAILSEKMDRVGGRGAKS
jgi:MFS family permease